MRKVTTIGFLLFAVLVIPDAIFAQPADAALSYAPQSLIPAAVEKFNSPRALTADAVDNLSGNLSTAESEMLSRPATLSLAEPENATGGGTSYLPVLFSAILPGTGEIYLGYKWRGAALLAMDVLAWTGYFYYHNEGLDSREEYESFADEYWNQSKWISDHPDAYPLDWTFEELEEWGMGKSGDGEWPGYIVWAAKEDDKQHYYENIGKYDWFISGWADFNPEIDDPFQHDTALRDEYRAMRKQSNDELNDSNKFLYLNLGLRVFSVIETLFLVRSSEHKQAGEDVSQNYFRLETRPVGYQGAEIALEYRFK